MPAFLEWLFRRIQTYPVIAFGLLFAAMSSLVLGMGAIVRGLDPVLLFGLSTLGLIAGWRLARLRGWAASLLIGALGLVLVLLGVGGLTGAVAGALGSVLAFSLQLMRPPYGQPDPAAARAVLGDLALQLNAVFVHLRDWLASVAALQTAFDPVAVNLAWCLIFWLITAWAAWWVARYDRPLPGLAPILIVLALVTGITGQSAVFLVPLLAALLLLLPLASHHSREQRWEKTEVDYTPEVRSDLALHAALLVGGLTLAAFFVPSISIDRIADFVRDAIRSPDSQAAAIPESLGLEPLPERTSAFAPIRAPGLPRDHLIGSGPELSRQIVMVVSPQDATRRYYWRSASYDLYTGRGWVTSGVSEGTYPARVEVPFTAMPGQLPVEVFVQLAEGREGVVYTPGRLITLDSDFEVAWRSEGDLFGAATTARTYTVRALLAAPGEVELNSAPNLYPEAIADRYLALPDSVPRRVLALARELTATQATPYERAVAIETYLRAYRYTLDLPAPPPNRDVADYFLFELREGYCDYYATAMVVLARAAGLPARLVVGYAAGSYDENTGQYTVTEAEAHSWVEVYFEGLGWVEFEPTGGRAPLLRPQTIEPAITASLTPAPAAEAAGRGWPPFGWPGAAGVALLIAGLAAAWGALDRIRLGRLTPSQTVSVLYGRLVRNSRPLRLALHSGDTPFEFAHAFAERLRGLGHRRGWLKPAPAEVQWLVDSYVRTVYSPRPPDRDEQRRAIRLWRKLGWRLWGARLLK